MNPRSWLTRFAVVLGLHTLAIAQPVLSLAADAPELFILRKAPDAAVVSFALWVALGIPALVLLLELGAERARRGAGWAVHLTAIGIYIAALGVLFLKRIDLSLSLRAGIDLPGWLMIAIAAAVACALVWRFREARVAHLYLTLLAIAAPVVLALFLAKAPLGEATLPEPVSGTRPVPVVVVVFDELPTTSLLDARGRLDRERLPNFSRLADTSTWFTSATTVADETFMAVPAILSGRRPAGISERPSLKDWPSNILTLLRGQYREAALEPATRLCPDSECGDPSPPVPKAVRTLIGDSGRIIPKAVMPLDIADDLPPVVGEQGTLPEPTEELRRFLAARRPVRGPELLVMHVVLPHSPWRFLPSGRTYPTPEDGPLPRGYEPPLWTEDASIVRSNWRRHLLQVGYTDTVLGRIVRRLREIGAFDRALLIVTADHGISFEPGHEMRIAREHNLGATAAVPLFVKLPQQRRGRRATRTAETVDIVPTILDVIGAPRQNLAGASLLAPGRSRRVSVHATDDTVVSATSDAVLRQRGALVRKQAALIPENPRR